MTSSRDFVRDLTETAFCHEAVYPLFLARLVKGDLPDPEGALRTFAFQYRGYSRHFTRYVKAVINGLERPDHKALLQENLDEECGVAPPDTTDEHRNIFHTRPHTELFADFQKAIGVDDDYKRTHSLVPEVERWAESMLALCSDPNAAKGVGAIGLGTELIVSRIYGQILQALDDHTSLSDDEKIFFTLHAELDEEHAEALVRIAQDLAQDEANRFPLREGMMQALKLRVGFWNALLMQSLAMKTKTTKVAV